MAIPEHQHLVAVVDDNLDMRDMLKDMLERFGYRVDAFASAEAFLMAAPTTRASCVLLDVELGGMSGLQLARELEHQSHRFPMVFMTASSSISIEKQAIERGCVAFVKKPFTIDRLLEAVKKAVAPKPDPSMFRACNGEQSRRS